MKGVTKDILVHRNFFKNAGRRAINLGGSTGEKVMRDPSVDYEATSIEVAGNRFFGSNAPVAFVTAQGGYVHHNTIVLPDKWVLRILQEKPSPPFKKCSGGRFEHNLIVFNKKLSRFVNIGPNTRPDSFSFVQNAWFDLSGFRDPELPVDEKNGIYGIDPQIIETGRPGMRMTSNDEKLKNIGARYYKR
jgi:hypothetical protein